MEGLIVALFASAAILLVLAVVAVLLRIYVRVFMIKSFGADDYLMVIALAFYIVSEALTFNATGMTQGKNLLEILEVLTPASLDLYFTEIFYVITILTVKLSIGAFLLRIVQSKHQRYTVYGVLLVNILFSIVYLCLVIFQCTPISHFWLPFSNGHCLPGRTNTITSFIHATLNGTSDLILATIPIFVVRRANMNTYMKISVAGLLGLGAVGGITSFARMPYIKDLERVTPIDFFDVTAKLAIWTCIEPGVGIFVGSVATLRPIFKQILGGSGIFTFGSASHSQSTSRASRGRGSNNQYLRSDQSTVSHPLDTFADANKKAGFTTTVIEGSVTKIGRSWFNRSQSVSLSEVGLRRSAEEDLETGGIHRTVEFEAISTTRMTPVPTKDWPLPINGLSP